VRIGDETGRNEWPLWFFPRDPWAGLTGVALLDPAGRLADLPRLVPGVVVLTEALVQCDERPTTNDEHNLDQGQHSTGGQGGDSSFVIIATAWTAALRGSVERGGRAVLLQTGGGPPGPLPVAALPFWREAIRLCEPHPAWGDFPHEHWAGAQFIACATDYALDTAGYPGAEPVLRRLDTRTMAVHDYAAELPFGDGRLIITTLRLEGGQGDQPLGISRSPAANYLLAGWVRYLGYTAPSIR
jgi:hypothetical protein